MLFALLLSCSDYTISEKIITEEELYSDIIVIPELIEFGHIISGQEIGEEVVSVINAGQTSLNIHNIGIYGSDNFSRENVSISELDPGESFSFVVKYTPETYEDKSATLYIESDSPNENISSVNLHGYGDAPIIKVTPNEIINEDIEIGCEEVSVVNVENLGNLDLIINDLTLWVTPPINHQLSFENELPLVVGPNSNIDINLSYIPDDLGSDYSILEILSNDPISEAIELEINSSGIYSETIKDSFAQSEINKVDILFVIDNSGSMSMFQMELASNMNTFMSVYSSMYIDYQIAAITTDRYMLQGSGIVTSFDPDPVGSFSSIITNIGVYGSGMERGLEMSYEALSTNQSAGPGSAFLRQDASLVIVYVSDERDYSHYYNSNNWSTYVSYFDTLKSDPSMIISHAVVGDYPSGCQWTNGNYNRYIEFGAGYYDVTQYYGGNLYSICAPDWGQQMQSMAYASMPVLSYTLSEDGVIEDTISVTVEGQLNYDWSFNSSENTIEFEIEDAPEQGEVIEVEYSILGCQDDSEDDESG